MNLTYSYLAHWGRNGTDVKFSTSQLCTGGDNESTRLAVALFGEGALVGNQIEQPSCGESFLWCGANETKDDRGFKIRSLITKIRAQFQQFEGFDKTLAVDEMMIRYFGRNNVKQCIRGKPVCFENNLLIYLANKPFRGPGTIRENRLQKCPLEDSRTVKKSKQGSFDYRYDTNREICLVRWNDNRCVNMVTNYDTISLMATVQKYCRKEKKKISVLQPAVIKTYNKSMRSVDQHDWLVGLLDMVVVNSWILYRHIHGRFALIWLDSEEVSVSHF
ncbi:hypothetical protein ILUMI_13736 [Ignelater luminosus]|uniref:PiggyBac transposable element-derived protein domain-containing protein n=1 Tax=Ignelater luminosus TaxID=2038154 RepID=A0A8K0GBN0_IGNLU|nr:hypothetical protein ILUMI_13736 [Ignelater luminosus]